MNHKERGKFGKILLDSSAPADGMERCLHRVAGEFVKVMDGEDAIQKGKRATFDMT